MFSPQYIAGVQAALAQADRLGYENEKTASLHVEALGQALEQLNPDGGALATEGADLSVTHFIADGLCKMAEYAHDGESVMTIIEETRDAIAESGLLKTAAAPGDNNVVAGHNPGRVAKGESSAHQTDHDEELSNAVPNTAKRPSVFSPHPGKTGVKGGVIGSEKAAPGAEGKGKKYKDHDKELSNAVPNTAKRPNAHGKPGHTGIKGGEIGAEKQASLSGFLATL